MKTGYTSHAIARMQQRGVLYTDVVEALAYPDNLVKKAGKYFYRRNLGRGVLEVCCQKTETHIKVITVYWV